MKLHGVSVKQLTVIDARQPVREKYNQVIALMIYFMSRWEIEKFS
jgi:hypothetical protein